MAEEKAGWERPSLTEFQPSAYEAWKQEAVATLKGADFNKKLLTKTYEGVTLQPIYTKEDFAGDETFPGEGDYLRGVNAAGYMDQPWDIAQRVKSDSIEKANEQLLHQLSRGATAVNIDLIEDVPYEQAADLDKLLRGVDLTKTALHIRTGASSLKAISFGVLSVPNFKRAKGMVGGDPLGQLAAAGRLCKALPALYDEMAEAVRVTKRAAKGVRPVLVDANVYASGGATAVQEIAYAMATASEYISAMMERGVSADDAASSIRFAFSLGANFFMEISKLRASRVVFSRMAGAFGAGDAARKIDVFARTASFTKTVYDPYVNLLRATTESFAGVVGGVNAMEVAPLGEPICGTDEATERAARNIQIMLQQEFDLLEPVDPAGGSWYVEKLTAELIAAISDQFKAIEAAGGMFAALKAGTVQAEISKVLADRFSKLATRYDRAVGTNMYANTLEKPLDLPAAYARCSCCEAEAYPVTVQKVEAHRWTEQFEAVRRATEAYTEATGRNITVFLANMGPIPQHKARADFATGFFEVGGFQVLKNDGFACPNCAAAAAKEADADVTVICSTDETYPELVPALAKAIKEACPDTYVVLAGAPAPEMKAAYEQAGVDDYIHVRANCLQILQKIQAKRGIGA